jgi:hypothetical protein
VAVIIGRRILGEEIIPGVFGRVQATVARVIMMNGQCMHMRRFTRLTNGLKYEISKLR